MITSASKMMHIKSLNDHANLELHMLELLYLALLFMIVRTSH